MLNHTLRIAAVSTVLALVPAAAQAAGKTRTLRFYDKAQALTVTHPDGTVVDRPPYPEMAPGDVLDVYSLDFAGTRKHHAKRWTGSNHLHCLFGAGEPDCQSHVAFGSSMMVFDGNPGTLVAGTGRFAGATGRVVTSKEVPGGADVVAKIRLP
jgi:hypothetical protein